MKECISHHNACDCREARFAEMEARIQELENPSDGRCMEIFALRKYRDQLIKERDEWKRECDDLAHRLLESEVARAKAVEALNSSCREMLQPECRYCGTHVVRGHAKDCFIGAALAAQPENETQVEKEQK